jgi:hypothetical protein
MVPVKHPNEVKPPDHGSHNVAPLNHRTYAYVAARETLRDGTDDMISDHLSDRAYVLRRQRVLVHERVHGRVDVRRRRGRQRSQQRRLFLFLLFIFIYSFHSLDV